jgi:uncharacterized membrane protein YqgA involved in biofilm formation
MHAMQAVNLRRRTKALPFVLRLSSFDNMTGTLINTAAVVIGSLLGVLFGERLPERLRQTVVAGIGLFTALFGIQMFLKTENSLIVLGSLIAGGILGEWWQIEAGLQGIGAFLERRFSSFRSSAQPAGEEADQQAAQRKNNFIRGFLTASLVYCIGPVTILGSIQDGLTGDYSLLVIKSILDGFMSIAFASTLGIGVMFSALAILVYQGTLSLLASQAQAYFSPAMMNEMTAVGGVLLLGIALSGLLEIKPIRVGNFLPALAIAPIVVAVIAALGK